MFTFGRQLDAFVKISYFALLLMFYFPFVTAAQVSPVQDSGSYEWIDINTVLHDIPLDAGIPQCFRTSIPGAGLLAVDASAFTVDGRVVIHSEYFVRSSAGDAGPGAVLPGTLDDGSGSVMLERWVGRFLMATGEAGEHGFCMRWSSLEAGRASGKLTLRFAAFTDAEMASFGGPGRRMDSPLDGEEEEIDPDPMPSPMPVPQPKDGEEEEIDPDPAAASKPLPILPKDGEEEEIDPDPASTSIPLPVQPKDGEEEEIDPDPMPSPMPVPQPTGQVGAWLELPEFWDAVYRMAAVLCAQGPGDQALCGEFLEAGATAGGLISNPFFDDEAYLVLDVAALQTARFEWTGAPGLSLQLLDERGQVLVRSTSGSWQDLVTFAETLLPGRYYLRIFGTPAVDGGYEILWTSDF